MSALTNTDMFELVTRLNAEYQPPGMCAATPRRLRVLVDAMQKYTNEVQAARQQYKDLAVAAIALGPGGIAVSELLGGGDVDVAQWRSDMTNWQFRLADYRRMLEQYISEHPTELDTPAGCEAIYKDVTSPLLDGVWYRVMPGVVLSQEERQAIQGGGASNRKPNDVITPWTLGNQIAVYQDAQRENAIRFFDDLIENAKKVLDPEEWPWWIKGAVIVGAGVAVGMVGLYVYQFLPKAPRQSNPRRRKRLSANPMRQGEQHWHVDITEGEVVRGGAGPWHFAILKGQKGDDLVYSGAGFASALDAAKSVPRVFEEKFGGYPPRGWLHVTAPKEAERYLMRKEGGARRTKNPGDPRKLYSDATIMHFYAKHPDNRRGSLEEGTAEELIIDEDRVERWRPLTTKVMEAERRKR